MKVPITNHCQTMYTPNPERLIARILAKIPDKFLVGLDEVRLFDTRPKHVKRDIVCTPISSSHSAIDVYMEKQSLRLVPGFSRVLFNMAFLGAVTEHIMRDIQPHSDDPDILAFDKPYRMNMQWGCFGLWTPILGFLRSIGYVVKRVPLLRAEVLAMSHAVIKQTKTSRTHQTNHKDNSDKDSR